MHITFKAFEDTIHYLLTDKTVTVADVNRNELLKTVIQRAFQENHLAHLHESPSHIKIEPLITWLNKIPVFCDTLKTHWAPRVLANLLDTNKKSATHPLDSDLSSSLVTELQKEHPFHIAQFHSLSHRMIRLLKSTIKNIHFQEHTDTQTFLSKSRQPNSILSKIIDHRKNPLTDTTISLFSRKHTATRQSILVKIAAIQTSIDTNNSVRIPLSSYGNNSTPNSL